MLTKVAASAGRALTTPIKYGSSSVYNNAIKSLDQIKDGDIRTLLYNLSVCLPLLDLHLNHIPFLLTADKLFRALGLDLRMHRPITISGN